MSCEMETQNQPTPEEGGSGQEQVDSVAEQLKDDRESVKLTEELNQQEADEVKKSIDNKSNTGISVIQPTIGNTGLDADLKDDKEKDATKKQQKNPLSELFSRLQLQDRYNNNLTSAKFLQIGPALKHDQDISEADLCSVYVQQLLMLDYRTRYVQVKQKQSKQACDYEDTKSEDSEESEFFSNRNSDRVQSEPTMIHPLDVQMGVFHCADSFLKQKIVTKLSQCQYALPLLVPHLVTKDIQCHLWTFRQMHKTWKKTETKEDSKVVSMKLMPICKAQTPMVFCFRLGSLSVSKSQLINSLISDRHNTFFHRNCPGSSMNRVLLEGVAEIAWYCPAGKPNDTFNDCVAFCNLHGDGLTYEEQLNVLKDKSSINVILLPMLDQQHESAAVISALLKAPKPLIVLIEDSADRAKEIKRGKYKVGLKGRSQFDVSEELKRIIRESLSGTHTLFQLESVAQSRAVIVDENQKYCQRGLSAAKEIMTTIGSVNIHTVKSVFLPCQGHMWHEWCKLNKEQYQLKGNVEVEKLKKLYELQKLREEQVKFSNSGLIKCFIKHLSSLSPTERLYFLNWTQVLLDDHGTDYLSSLRQSYDQKWSKLLDIRKKTDKSNELKNKQAELAKKKQEELVELSKNLESATCGLEHIFREMGQIYEAHMSLKVPHKAQSDWYKYPALAAKLMVKGHPLELMDGDAGQVPLIWISSLFNEVIKELGNKKVFVLSILGIQSSGKSTMLNAMFGLQFAVSAGRCTRGAYMQLVQLSDDMKKDFKWEYILVVDTEGLRALELEGNTTVHDNELATFVVGLGNMTVVNIFGENPSDMQDILQIVVQAFMRMSEVQLSPSCVFVHQNVTDVAAAEKNMDGKRKLIDKLDQMVQLAAKEESYDADSFSDIIEFDVQKDVKYFAQLWEGSPPMAPPNPGYSECVQDLKNFILNKASKSPGVTLFELKTKVNDLWNALLNENFVFSFRNTLEVAVYRQLEVEFGNWTWALRSEMLKIEEQRYIKIENGMLDPVYLDYLREEIKDQYNEIRNSMSAYFNGEKHKEMLVQWKSLFEKKIQNFQDELVQELYRKLSDVIEQKKTSKKMDEKMTLFENSLLQKSKELAHELKDKANDEQELRYQFNWVWTGWVTELTQGTKPIEDIRYEEDVTNVLQEHNLVSESKNLNKWNELPNIADYSVYVAKKRKRQKPEQDEKSGLTKVGEFFVDTGTKVAQYLTGHLPADTQQQIRDLILRVENQALQLIKTKPVSTRGYSSSYLREVAQHVKSKVVDFESQWTCFLKKEFTVDLALFVFDRIKNGLTKSHKQFIKNNDARMYLESRKGEYYSVFRSFCKGSSSAVVLAERICENLRVSMTEAVCNRTAISIAGDMRCNYPAFKENRLNLEQHVLESLAEKEDFVRYINYIRDPKTYIETFIKEEVKEYILKEEKVRLMLKKNVIETKNLVSQALFEATDRVQEGDIDMWLQEFHSLLKDKLTVGSVPSQNFRDVNKFDFLKDAIEKRLAPIVEELELLPLEKKSKFRLQPDKILIDQLCNCCWVKCPFCGAVCTHTVKDHTGKHSVPFHRPSGITRWHFRGTVELVIDFCTTLVASKLYFYPNSESETMFPYKEFQTAGGKYADWLITSNGSKLVYWKWFISRFQKELEDYYKLKFEGRGEIPSEWKSYTKEESVQSLEEIYNL